jgi:hypothetical protein
MAFSKKKVDDRKRWLSAYQPGTFLDQSVDAISYKDFVHKVMGCVGGAAVCGCGAVVGWVLVQGESAPDAAPTMA